MWFTIVLFVIILLTTLCFAFFKERDSLIVLVRQHLGWSDPMEVDTTVKDESDLPEDQSTRSEQSGPDVSKATNSVLFPFYLIHRIETTV